jgi:hypothetical protein
MRNGSADPRNPSGTWTGCVNCASLDTESIRNRLAAGELAGEFRGGRALDVREHGQAHQGRERLPVARDALGIDAILQGPECRSAECLRRIERGHRDLRILERHAAVGKFKIVVDDDSSVVATSMLSSRENAAGDWVRSENNKVASCGSSPGSASWMLLLSIEGDGCTLLLIRTTRGRGASIAAAETGNTRPSLSLSFAAAARSGFRAAAACASSRPSAARRRRRGVDSSPGSEHDASDREARDLVEAAALENSLGVAGVHAETLESSRLRKCLIAIGCGSLTPYCVTISVIAPGSASCSGSLTSTSLGLTVFHSAFSSLPAGSLSMMPSIQLTLSARK